MSDRFCYYWAVIFSSSILDFFCYSGVFPHMSMYCIRSSIIRRSGMIFWWCVSCPYFPKFFRISILSMTISLFSWTSCRSAFGSVWSRCLSYSWNINFCLIALKSKSVSYSTLMPVSYFIAPKVNDALFIGIGAVSLMVIQFFGYSSSRTSCKACFFCSSISTSVSIVSSGSK